MKNLIFVMLAMTLLFISCDDDDSSPMPLDPDTATKAIVDRFSENAATLMVRNDENGLPEANEPIDYDSGAPFLTQGYGPDGNVVQYYNFDVQSTTPAPIYLFFDEEDNMVENQINIVDVIPGDAGYNDFWQVFRVIVPDNYTANSITNERDLLNSGYDIEETSTIVNCPIVPDGSTASKRYASSEDNSLHRGWYKDQVIYYFSFFEKTLDGGSSGQVPLSPIYVTFNINPDGNNPASGPASGFRTEDGSIQTHNVLATIPDDNSYSPLWSVNVYDNADFDLVTDINSIANINVLANGVANVNCPVVFKE